MKWLLELLFGCMSKERRKCKDEDDEEETERLKSKVRELERMLQDFSLSNEADPPGIAQLPARDSSDSRSASVGLTESVGFDLTNDIPTMNPILRAIAENRLSETYHQQGIFARPECQQRYHYGKSRGKQREKEVELSRSRSRRKVKNSDELVSHYCAISTLGPVMRECKELWWKQSMYTPLASQFLHAPIPRITLSCLDKLLGEAADPCSLQIFKKTGLSLEEIYKEYGWRWGELPLDMVWANQSTLKRWGQKNLKTLIQFMDNMVKPKSYAQMMESVNVSSLVRGDLQPKRHMYFYYGSKPGVREEACASIIQVSPVLVEVKHKIYYGQLYQTNAPLKYPKEVKNAVSRAHAVFKYTETALTIFTPCGTILQQNPSSSKIFGMEACGNNVFSDFGKDGKPVNRLRALFGGNESQYRDMMETVMEEDEIWWAEMKLGREDLMNLGRTSLSDSTLGASGDGQKEEEEVTQSGGSDSAVWYIVHLSKFSDPADGKTTIFCEMKNIHAAVLQEERLREAKKHEYEILQNIIPKHIIDHLIQKEKEVARARSLGNSASRSSTSSDDFLDIDISAFRMIDDDKVGAMAQHYSQVTVFFADIVGFTNMSSHSTPADIMIMLNRLFTLFDDICDNHNIYKVETIGDAYMCVAGLNMKSEAIQGGQAENTCSKYHAKRMLVFAKDVLSNAKTVISPENTPVEVRIGLHTGDVVTGVVGYKMPRFCLFGDTVNVASRMESTGRAGHIHASQATRDLVPHEHWIPTGGVAVKGKGLVPTYTCGGCIEDGDLNPSDKICDCC